MCNKLSVQLEAQDKRRMMTAASTSIAQAGCGSPNMAYAKIPTVV